MHTGKAKLTPNDAQVMRAIRGGDSKKKPINKEKQIMVALVIWLLLLPLRPDGEENGE